MLPLKALKLAIAILHSNPALKIARLEWQRCRKHLAERQEVVDNNNLDQETRFKMSNYRSCLWDWQDKKQHGQRSHREVQQDDSLNWGNRMTCHWQTILLQTSLEPGVQVRKEFINQNETRVLSPIPTTYICFTISIYTTSSTHVFLSLLCHHLMYPSVYYVTTLS